MRSVLTSRRGFCAAGSALVWGPWLGAKETPAKPLFSPREPEIHESFPQTADELAHSMVSAAHFRIDEVRKLLKENKSLAKASWDWGFGDWETAIGAASHTGRRDIIQLLIEHGARPTLFTFAAMDQVDVVRSVCANIPDVQGTLGPHGITLYQHAVNAKSARVMEYLESLPATQQGQPGRSISKAEAKPYLGTYRFGAGEKDRFEVIIGKTIPRIGMRRVGGTVRYLAMTQPHVFNVYGSEQVQIRFDVSGKVATRLTVVQGSFQLAAERVT